MEDKAEIYHMDWHLWWSVRLVGGKGDSNLQKKKAGWPKGKEE